MHLKTFEQGMALFVKSFPDKPFDSDVMWEFLQDLDDADFLKAVAQIVMTNKDINRATNLVALIREIAIPLNETAGEAWGIVLKNIQTIGSYGRPNFEDPCISKAVDCIGWRNLCLSENIAIERAHFLKIYESLENRSRKQQLTQSHDVNKLIQDITKNIGSPK